MKRAAFAGLCLSALGCQVILGIDDHTLRGGGDVGGQAAGGLAPTGGGPAQGGGGAQSAGGAGGAGGSPPALQFGTPSDVVTGLGPIDELERDGNGDLYALIHTGSIERIVGGNASSVVNGLDQPIGLGLAASEVLTAVAENGGNCKVEAFAKSGGGPARVVASIPCDPGTQPLASFDADATRFVAGNLAAMATMGKRSELRAGASDASNAVAGIAGYGVDKMTVVQHVAVHDGALYWIDSAGDTVFSSASGADVTGSAPPGAGVTTVAAGFSAGVDLAWSSSTLYLATGSQILRVDADPPSPLTSAQGAHGLHADDAFVFWAEGSTVKAYELATGAVGVVDTVPDAKDITSDADAVIYATASGRIVRVPKP